MPASPKEVAQAHREGGERAAAGKNPTTFGDDIAGSQELNHARERGGEEMAVRIEQAKEDKALDQATT
jgi:hypothetical protein